jgi:Uma2 family endonuclease
MATATETPVETQVADQPYSLTSDDYERMVETGIIPREKRVYLWDGELYEKMAKSTAHAVIQAVIAGALSSRLSPGFWVSSEHPVRLDQRHTPLPDVVVVKGRPFEYLERYPGGQDVVLLVEVAVTSLPRDLGVRLSHFATSLPEATYLVADVKNRRVLVHRGPRPDPPGYSEVETVGPGGALRLTVGGQELAPIPFEEIMG